VPGGPPDAGAGCGAAAGGAGAASGAAGGTAVWARSASKAPSTAAVIGAPVRTVRCHLREIPPAADRTANANTTGLRCTRASVATGVATFVAGLLDDSSFGRPACRDSARARSTVENDEDDAARTTNGTEEKRSKARVAGPCFLAEGERLLPSVGLLARGSCCAPSPFPEAAVVDVQPRVVWEIASPVTVAGPRRLFTGLPFYALTGTESIFYSVVRKETLTPSLRRVSR